MLNMQILRESILFLSTMPDFMIDSVTMTDIEKFVEKAYMEKIKLVQRAKMYMKLLSDGVHPVTGEEIPECSVVMDCKVKLCFEFISQVLDEYVELFEKVEKLEREKENNTIVVTKKQAFAITQEQCDNIKLSKEPITILSFMKNINSVIDSDSMEKLTSTRINKWLTKRGLVTTEKIQAVVNKTVYKPSDLAVKVGIVEKETVDKKSGELKAQIKLEESAQLYIIENLEDIILTT